MAYYGLRSVFMTPEKSRDDLMIQLLELFAGTSLTVPPAARRLVATCAGINERRECVSVDFRAGHVPEEGDGVEAHRQTSRQEIKQIEEEVVR